MHEQPAPPRIGTAGWAIPRSSAQAFPAEGSQLVRYAARFDAVEINSSFHRPHRQATYARWAGDVPADFRFAVKLPKTISHERRLVDCAAPLERFCEEAGGLGSKLGVVLLQLPPTLNFDVVLTDAFLGLLARSLTADIACEPRHASWFTPEAEALLVAHRVARVAADPVLAPGADRPGGWPGLVYRRLHGSPVVYRSSYDDGRLDGITQAIAAEAASGPAWCIFDNTASGAATADALKASQASGSGRAPPVPPAEW